VKLYSLARRARAATVGGDIILQPRSPVMPLPALQSSATVRPLSGALGVLVVLASLTMAAPLAVADPADVVGSVCTQVVGLAPGEKHYAACVESLTHSVQSLHRGEGLAVARQACLAHGYPTGSPGLAECELAATPAATATGGPSGDTAIPGGSRSYFDVSRHTAFERDQLACARLGFEPAAGGFDDCVADLRAALAQASTSMM